MSKRKETISRTSILKKWEIVKGLYILSIIIGITLIGIGHRHPRRYSWETDVSAGNTYTNVTIHVHPNSVIKLETTDNLAETLPAEHLKLLDIYIEENVTDIPIYVFIVKGLATGITFHVERVYVVDLLGVVKIVHAVELRKTRGVTTIIASTMALTYWRDVYVRPLKKRRKVRRRKIF